MFKLVVLAALAIASCNAFPRALNPKLRGMDLKIVGGNETTIEEHPWQISIRTMIGHHCGGSLISKDTVVTSANCVVGFDIEKVVVGTSSITKGGISLEVTSSVVHKKYNSWDRNHDIAILKLKGEVELSDSVQIVKLPEQGKTVADGTEVTVTGWGVVDIDDYVLPDILREVQVNIVEKKECKQAYPYQVGDTMICAGVPEGGKDACAGDSGSPLTVGDTLYGIVSWGYGCGEPGYPGVYTDVAIERDWIKTNSGV